MFHDAVKGTEEIKDALKSVLKALGRDSTKVRPKYSRKCEGSVNIDTHLSSRYPSATRWDYAVGYDQRTYFIEIHPATTGEIKVVINKLTWLRNWLKTKAPAFNREDKSYHWIPSGKNALLKDSPQALNLAKNGISLEKKVMTLE